MGAVIATVLGGSQALSRSLYSRMIPPGREASFFGVYEISERGTSWIGPILFGIVAAATNSYRQAILSLIVLFLGGDDRASPYRHRPRRPRGQERGKAGFRLQASARPSSA